MDDWDEPNAVDEWVCYCDMCQGIASPPEPEEPGPWDVRPLEYGESLHLDGCTLPGDHSGPCKGPNLGLMIL